MITDGKEPDKVGQNALAVDVGDLETAQLGPSQGG